MSSSDACRDCKSVHLAPCALAQQAEGGREERGSQLLLTEGCAIPAVDVETHPNLLPTLLLPIWLHAGKLSNKDKDGIEEEVGATVRAAGQQLEQLKGSVVAAQQQQQSYEDGGGAAINEHTAAHLHGVVSITAVGKKAAAYAPGALLAITCSQTTYHSRIRQQRCDQSRCTLLWALSAPAGIAPFV